MEGGGEVGPGVWVGVGDDGEEGGWRGFVDFDLAVGAVDGVHGGGL